MSDQIDRLKNALAGRYDVERELGAGGMARVYLAHDIKHQRQVAVKVLRPELAAALGPERFLREIEIAARLNHPHILPLHDSGERDGFLYYVMPFVAGESLRSKLNREKQLDVEEAIRIAEQVAAALDYAHRQGVIHRDIKPENVLLHEGVATVMDFGIARAVSQVSNERLTETGLSIGTPAYMSPEQVSGDRELDGRCDVYSLGVMLYEMLTGETPYTGATAQVIVAKQFTDPIPSVRRIRPAVSGSVDETLTRSLAKTPADRWSDAAQFASHLRQEPSARASAGRPMRITMSGAAAVLVAIAIWFLIPRGTNRAPSETDPAVLAVLPFEVRGSDEFAYLREGMIDLVSTKLDGVGGLHVVDPHTTLALFDESTTGPTSPIDARRLAATLGAGRTLQGSLLRVEGALQVRASVYGPGDDDRIDASVNGPADRLFELVDELVRRLVASGLIGEEAPLSDLQGLTTSSNEALRLYLTGIQNFRTGRGTQETFGLLTQAVNLDSTFALAAYWAGYVAAYDEIEDPLPYLALAQRHQDRLGQRDRLRLTAAVAGAEGRHADAIRLYEAFVGRYADDVAGWFQLGEQLAHTGHFDGRTLAEARPAYERAVALDPALAPAFYHLSHIGGLQADSMALAVWGRQLDSLGVDSLWIVIPKFVRAVVVHDSAGTRQPFDRLRAGETDIPAATMAGSMGELLGATLEHAPRESRALLWEFGARALSDTARTVTARRVARIESASARFVEAERALRGVEADLGSVLAQDLATVALHPANLSVDRLQAAVRALSAVSLAPGTGEAAVRHYLLARLGLRLGQPAIRDEHRTALVRFESANADVGRFAADLGSELDALIARDAGEPTRALETLLEASYWNRAQAWLGFPPESHFDGHLADRFPMFLRAELLRDAGQDTAAAIWYGVAADGIWHRGPALLGLAQVRARQGQRQIAGELFRRVRSLWSEGDIGAAELLDSIQAHLEIPNP